MLAHLFFCNRSSNSNEGNYRSYSRLFVNDASDFVSSIRYLFILIFSRNNVFDKDLELLFAKVNLKHFSLDLLYHSRTHYTLVDSNQNRCMYFLVAKQPCELAVKLCEVWIRILINNIVSISNDFLINDEFGLSRRKEKRALFLDSCVQFLKSFYSVACKLLNANAFVFMYEKMKKKLKIVSKSYLDYFSRKKRQAVMHMKAFLHFLKRFLNDKYPHMDFDFYLSCRAQNVYIDLNNSLLALHENEQIISDIVELWLMKEHGTKFKFILPHLCPLCRIKIYFHQDLVNLEEYLDRNQSNLLKLKSYAYKPYPFLMECYHVDKRSLEAFSGHYVWSCRG